MCRPVLSLPKGLACLLPLLAASGCVHTGTFEAPVPVPAGRTLVSIGGASVPQPTQSPSEEVLILTSVEGRMSFSTGPVTLSLRGAPGSVGAGARVQMPTAFPLAVIGGGGVSIWEGSCDVIACATGPSGYAGVSVGAPLRADWVPYLSARLVASQVELKSCGGDETTTCTSRPATEPLSSVVSLGIAPQRGGVHIETSVLVQHARGLDGYDLRHDRPTWVVAPSFGVLLRVLL